MSLKRSFYIGEDLNDLKILEKELESSGVGIEQIHVLSQNDAEIEHHDLHQVEAVLKKDVVYSMEKGAVVGVVASVAVLGIAYLFGWTDSAAGWMPFVFLSIVILGFCAWEGGLFGIQEPHHQFKRFQEALAQGKHVFFVDINARQEDALTRALETHPNIQLAGEGEATPEWIVQWQKNWRGFIKTMP